MFRYLKSALNELQLLFGYFQLPFRHVGRLLAVERISDASRYEHVQLYFPFPLFFFSFLFILENESSQTFKDKCFHMPLHHALR